MKKILNISATYPRLALMSLLLLSALAILQLGKLKVDISAQSMMVKSDPLWLTYQKTLKTFGSDNVVIIFLQDKNLFTPDNLAKIKAVINSLEKLTFVNGSSSLFNAPNVREIDGYIVTKPFLDKIPVGNDEFYNDALESILSEAVNNPLIAQNLISLDANTMAINIFLHGAIHYPGLDSEITQAIEREIQPLTQQLDVVFQMGSSYVRDAISSQIQQDQKLIIPAALVILILVLGISLKRISCSIVPLSTAVLSIVLTLSIMAFLQIPINVLTSIVPALLIIIGSTEDVHLLAEYHRGIDRGLERGIAVNKLPENQSTAILLTFITTFVGFLSITINELEILTQFGWVVSMGLLINFLVTIIFIPAYLQLFGSKKVISTASDNLYQRSARTIFYAVIRFKKFTLILLLFTTVFFLWGSQYLQVNNNTLGYFPEDSDINTRALLIHRHLSGMQTFSIILDSAIDDTFLKVRYLEDVRKLQRFIEQRQVFDKSFSFADFIMLTHKVMDGAEYLSMPDEDELIQAYMGFVQFKTVKSYVSSDYSSARILVRHNLSSSRQLDAELQQIRQFIDRQLRTNLSVQFSGESVLTNRAADSMAIGQIQSLLLMVVAIFLLVAVLFIDIRAGLLAIVPNIFPVIILFGIMGYMKIPLDTGTTMVAVIALGICVDDTIHFLSRYHHYTRGTQDVEKALLKTVEHEATPIMTTSVALALGFSVLTLSSFQPVVYFGALSALVMMLAMFSTFILTPVLLSYTRLITVWDMISLNLKSRVLRQSVFFNGLRNFEIKKAILTGDILQFSKGKVLVEQGQEGSDMYVILQGTVTITRKENDGSVHTIGRMGPGDLFGEIALLTDYQRTASVTSCEFVKVLVIKWDSISQLGRYHPRISMKLFRNLSSVIGKRLANQSINDSNMRDELTGAVTRHFLYEQLQLELNRAKRYGEILSLIILDIDLQKTDLERHRPVNEAGIKTITLILSEQTRSVDIFARWDEFRFVIVMPRTDSELALSITQRMKSCIESSDIAGIGWLHIKAVITHSNGDDDIDVLLTRIERQLDDMTQNDESLSITLA